MPELLALQGPACCGKSTTLIDLYNIVQFKYPAAYVQPLPNSRTGIAVVMKGVNGLLIGIESQGDPNSRLQNSLSHFANIGCDIIFCACRTKGMTVSWVNALSPQYNIHFVQQQVTNNYTVTNPRMAGLLMQNAGI